MLAAVPMLLLLAATVPAGAFTPRQELDAGRFLKVLDEAEARLRSNPGDALAWAAKAQALAALVRLPEALSAAQRSLALTPGLADGLLAQAMARAGLAIQEGGVVAIYKAVKRGLSDLEAAVQADPSLALAWETLGVSYQQIPGLFGGSSSKALECAGRLEQLDRPRGLTLRGTLLSMDGQWREAEPSFRIALGASPGNPNIVLAYLDALGSRETRKALGDQEQKNRLVQQARLLLPGVRGKARGIAAVCDALLDGDQGEEAWRTAHDGLAGCDAPSLLHLELGKISARSGVHRPEGLAYLDQVLREPLEGGTGGPASVQWRRGQILKAMGRTAEARAAAQEALRIAPNDNKAKQLLKELGGAG